MQFTPHNSEQCSMTWKDISYFKEAYTLDCLLPAKTCSPSIQTTGVLLSKLYLSAFSFYLKIVVQSIVESHMISSCCWLDPKEPTKLPQRALTTTATAWSTITVLRTLTHHLLHHCCCSLYCSTVPLPLYSNCTQDLVT